MQEHIENYGPFAQLIKNKYQEINTDDFTVKNYNDYFFGLLNILRDGIEDPEIQSLKVGVHMHSGHFIRLTLTDLFFQLIFWTFPVYIGEKITPMYFIDTRAITKNTIKNYFNMIIRRHETDIEFITMNNLIDDTLSKFKYVNEFAMYLCNTLNFKDTIDLMKKYPEFNESIHADLSGVPIEDVKKVGMDYAHTQIKYIKENEHCLRDLFVSGEAINPKQFKEVSVNIGTKPDGQGGVYPYVINKSFINGGVTDPHAYVIDAAVGRTAQILQKMNVGTSGAFARLLETNNLDTFFNENADYVCDTKNFIKVFIKDASWLSIYDRRYYRLEEDDPNEYCLDKYRDTHLIGKTLYFRSPITCESYARGLGICRKCYGNLYYVIRDINPGKIAAEILSSIYTQMLLSAKHLLESSIIKMNWNAEFKDIFDVNLNMLTLKEGIETEGMFMILDSSKFDYADEDDVNEDDSVRQGVIYEEYTPSFDIQYPDGTIVTMHTAEEDNIYLTEDLNRLLRSKKVKESEDGIYKVPLALLEEIPAVFTIKVQNEELQRTLEKSKHIINRAKDTSTFDKDSIVREFISANMEGGLSVTAIHLETIIANQMRDPDNILEMPHWNKKNAPYKILTLGSSLNNSPSITVTLEYQKIGATLVSPMSTKKKKPSVFDLYFMEKPQNFIVDKEMVSDKYQYKEDNDDVPTIVDGVTFIEDTDNG